MKQRQKCIVITELTVFVGIDHRLDKSRTKNKVCDRGAFTVRDWLSR